jgi:multidrug transporter EmrE-like cation transporter
MLKEILDKLHVWADKSIVDELLFFAVLIAFVETCAQNMLKNTDKDDDVQYIVGLFVYAIVGYLLHYTYQNFPLSKVNVIWSCLSIIIATSLGYLVYNENMNNLRILSIVLALGAVYCSYRAG